MPRQRIATKGTKRAAVRNSNDSPPARSEMPLRLTSRVYGLPRGNPPLTKRYPQARSDDDGDARPRVWVREVAVREVAVDDGRDHLRIAERREPVGRSVVERLDQQEVPARSQDAK